MKNEMRRTKKSNIGFVAQEVKSEIYQKKVENILVKVNGISEIKLCQVWKYHLGSINRM